MRPCALFVLAASLAAAVAADDGGPGTGVGAVATAAAAAAAAGLGGPVGGAAGGAPEWAAPRRAALALEHSQGRAGHPQLMQFCHDTVQSLPRSTRNELRDEVQTMQALGSKLRDATELLQKRREGVPTGEVQDQQYVWNHTWKTPFSVEELDVRVRSMQHEYVGLTSKVQGMLSKLSAELPPPALEPRLDLLRSCSMHALNPTLFDGRPHVSFMLQYYKRAWVIAPIVDSLIRCANSSGISLELLVNVDSPEDADAWVASAQNTSGMVVPVFSNNVHEARGYNRLASMARGKVLIVLQDDQILRPEDDKCGWLTSVTTLFDRFPLVGAIGLSTFMFGLGPNYNHDEHDPDIPAQGRSSWFEDPTTHIRAQFVQAVDFAPLAIRRSAFLHIGGLDESMSDTGECGIMSDHNMCAHMWAVGYQVMWMPGVGIARDTSHGEHGGTHRPEVADRCWGRQLRKGARMYEARWGQWNGPVMRGFAERAKSANLGIMRPAGAKMWGGGKCPFATGCEDFDLSHLGLSKPESQAPQ
ncbi:hypothetical protein FOA52_010696 [Chlamydomonas sp. UWO 241]|nr:hypothetical protein FOA52_010696 [Chlamydomonas sp. UWO 241]